MTWIFLLGVLAGIVFGFGIGTFITNKAWDKALDEVAVEYKQKE